MLTIILHVVIKNKNKEILNQPNTFLVQFALLLIFENVFLNDVVISNGILFRII